MAIKSSGQLSLRDDIRPEFGAATTNVSLRNLSASAGFSTPDAMSEFYGYSNVTNTHAVRANGNGFIGSQFNSFATNPQDYFQGGLWFRNNAPTARGQTIISIGDSWQFFRTGNRNYIIITYNSRFNRINVQVFSNGTRVSQRQYPLHDNSSITGITSSSAGWYSGQRGNTDADGFTYIGWKVLLNNGGTATNNIELWWNGQPLTFSVNNQNASGTRISSIQMRHIVIGDNIGATTFPTVSSFYGDFDDVFWNHEDSDPSIYKRIFETADHEAIYNAGRGSNYLPSAYNNGNTPTMLYNSFLRFDNEYDADGFVIDSGNFLRRPIRGFASWEFVPL